MKLGSVDISRLYIGGTEITKAYLGATQVYANAQPWDISGASFVQSFSLFPSPITGLFFRSDGLKMYVTDLADGTISEFNLSTAWDISTDSIVQIFSVGAQDTSPIGLFFRSDGLKMYFVGNAGGDVNEYNLGTAWDISTASYLQRYSVLSQITSPIGLFFRSDGLKMYVTDQSGRDVNEYNLGTAWDISTASYLQRYSVLSQDTGPTDVFFKPDGTKMYVAGNSSDAVHEYNLSTAWSVFPASYVQTFGVASQENNPLGLFFKPDGTKMYVAGTTSSSVNEYNLGGA